MYSISLPGVVVVELGLKFMSWKNGSSMPLCNCSHSIEYCLIWDPLRHSWLDWLASNISMMAWCCFWSVWMMVFRQIIALLHWQNFAEGISLFVNTRHSCIVHCWAYNESVPISEPFCTALYAEIKEICFPPFPCCRLEIWTLSNL